MFISRGVWGAWGDPMGKAERTRGATTRLHNAHRDRHLAATQKNNQCQRSGSKLEVGSQLEAVRWVCILEVVERVFVAICVCALRGCVSLCVCVCWLCLYVCRVCAYCVWFVFSVCYIECCETEVVSC